MRTTHRTLFITGGLAAALIGLLVLVINLTNTHGTPAARGPAGFDQAATITPTAAISSTAATSPTAASSARLRHLCGNSGTPGPVRHVVWIWMENESFSQVIGSGSAPYESQLAKRCGLATNFHNESHFSLDNYIAATDGQNILGTSYLGDCSPAPSTGACMSTRRSLFAQLDAAGKSWRSFAETMPSKCYRGDYGNYAVRHNPAVYYRKLSTCGRFDVPMGGLSSRHGHLAAAIRTGGLPAFSFITPNLIDDAHSSSTATGDAWLRKAVPLITSGPNYQAGNTVVFITTDEGAGSDERLGENCASKHLDRHQPSCHVSTIVVGANVPTGKQVGTFYTHYSMLRTTEDLLGLRPLGLAATAASMESAFRLGPHRAA
jgi:phosphatidylinositol-3-phosphatase